MLINSLCFGQCTRGLLALVLKHADTSINLCKNSCASNIYGNDIHVGNVRWKYLNCYTNFLRFWNSKAARFLRVLKFKPVCVGTLLLYCTKRAKLITYRCLREIRRTRTDIAALLHSRELPSSGRAASGTPRAVRMSTFNPKRWGWTGRSRGVRALSYERHFRV